MTSDQNQELLQKIEAEMEQLKSSDPELYLELLTTLNKGLKEITSELKKVT